MAAVMIIVMALGIGIYNTPANRINRHLDLGQNYLDEIQDLEEKYADEASKIEFPKASEQIDFDLSYTAILGVPDDITDAVHSSGGLLGVFGFEIISEGGNADTDVVKSENNGVNDWRDIYINYINEKISSDGVNGLYDECWTYKLININGDAIPELYIDYGSTVGGAVMCSIYNGNVIEQWMWVYGLSYMEGKNLFMESGGHMDVYWDIIYSIQNGKFVVTNRGDVGAFNMEHDANGEPIYEYYDVQYDANNEPIYEYYWNGVHVASEEEYNRLLNSVFDEQNSIKQWDIADEFCTYDEIVREINNY